MLALALAQDEVGVALRAARRARSWTLEDVAVALHQLDIALGEPESGIDFTGVWKWENGVRNPGRRYQARLCLVFAAMPAQLGFVPTPRLMRDIGELNRKRQERQATRPGGDEDDRLDAAVRHLWAVDRPLVETLEETVSDFARRVETERPDDVLPGLHRYRDSLDALLGRAQPAGLETRLLAIASQAAELGGYAAMVSGDNVGAWRAYAAAEVLGREAGSAELVAFVLAARSRLHSRGFGGQGDPARAIALLNAAELTVGSGARPALLAWVYGRRAEEHAELRHELESGRDLDAAFRSVSTVEPAAWNLFSDLDSAWLEQYRGARALGLGQGSEAVAVFEAVLGKTDARLLFERGVALTRLGWAVAIQGDIERASALLQEAVGLVHAHGDRRGVSVILRVRDQHLGRWRSEPAIKRLDEAIRATG